MLLTFLLVNLVNSAPLLLSPSIDLSLSGHIWPLWTSGHYWHHPSIRWLNYPPLIYINPHASSSLIAQNRLFPTFKHSEKNRKIVFQSESDLSHQSKIEPEHRSLDFSTDNSTDVIEEDFTDEVNVTNATETSNVTSSGRSKRDLGLEKLNHSDNEKLTKATNFNDAYKISETFSDIHVDLTNRKPRDVIFPGSETQSKTFSDTGKLVFDGLSMLGTAIAATAYNNPVNSGPLLHPAALPPPPGPTFGFGQPMLHPFVFPGPSALYPQMFPMGMGSHNYVPSIPSPYQALNVESLLVPLVGMVGLNLLVPDIAKTRRHGRPSDVDGLDVFRRLMEDEQCLKKLSCEAGVVLDPNDDPQTIKRALQVGLTARRKVPLYHHDGRFNQGNCAVHHCELNFDSLSRSSSGRSSSVNSTESPTI
ncbi:hypothetical protein CHUAL_004369 [Chamberlinius hualienensis]